MTKEIRITNIAEYVQTVCELNTCINENANNKFAQELLFRGQSNKDYKLLPSIARDRDTIFDNTIFNAERNLIEMAKYKMPDKFRQDQTPLELLALLQHHGIPTRLLDVTENSLVALFFACCSNQDDDCHDTDGEVIVFKHNNKDVTNYPIVNAITDSYHFTPRHSGTSLSDFYGNIKKQPYCLEEKQVFDMNYKNDDEGGKWIEECCKNIFYVYAPIRSLRQQVQQGRYILFPNHIDYHFEDYVAFTWKIDAIPKDHEDIALRIIVPKQIKKTLRNDLSVFGVSEEFLFCDNVDAVCKGIVDTFKKRC